MAPSIEYTKLAIANEENRGDSYTAKRCFNDALRSYKHALQMYDQLRSSGLVNINDIELGKMRIENKIRETEQLIAKNNEMPTDNGARNASNAKAATAKAATAKAATAKNSGASKKGATESIKEMSDNGSDDMFPVERSTGATFDDIIGLEDVKSAIKKALVPLRYPEEAAKYKLKPGGFFTLFGPPGTGKTSIARAITTEFDADMIVINSSDITRSLYGESEQRIKSLFEQINSSERFTILYFDDGESNFAKAKTNDAVQDRLLNEWKTQIDGFKGRANALIILSCNNPEVIDHAILSRSTSIFYVALPDEPARKAIFEKELSGIPLHRDVDLDELAKKTPLYSGRNIYTICDKAKRNRLDKVTDARERGRFVDGGVCQKDLLEALADTKPDTTAADVARYDAYAAAKAANRK